MRFEVLGPVRVLVGSAEIAVTARREQALLAMLLLRADQCLRSQQLVDAVWTGRTPEGAADQIHGIVYRLRRRLAAGGVPGEVIVTEPAGYRVRIDPHQIDLWEFRRLRDEARAAAADGRPIEAQRGYRAALGLWRGSALAGIDSPTVRQAAAVLEEERLRALEECVEIELGLGEAGELVVELTEWVHRHPYRELLRGALMRALYQAGRQADALAVYRHARQAFREELGTEPSVQLRELHQAILNRDPELAGPSPAQPLAAEPLTPRELPAAAAGFTGRTAAMQTLDDWLWDTDAHRTRIAVITGTAGVGKTTLAIQWAHRVRDQFPDGQLYINLQGHATGPPLAPVDALARFLRALGVARENIPVEVEEAASRYRSLLADRRVLVMLDNVATVAQVRPLLPGADGCLVLLTSRNQLGGLVAADGARRLTLDVLAPADAVALLSHVLGRERVGAEPAAAAELVDLCGSLPLALRIAAANLTARPRHRIAAYAAQLRSRDRLAALAVADDPHHAVTPAFDFSYTRLPQPAQRSFQILGLAPGPDVTADTIAVMAGITREEASDSLAALAAAHLAEEHTADRYACHDLLRRYAARQAAREQTSHEQAAALARLVDWYLQVASAAAGLLWPQVVRLPAAHHQLRPAPEWLADPAVMWRWLEAEWTNLVATITYAAQHGPRRQAYLLADALRGYCWHGGHAVDWLAIATIGLAAARGEADLSAQAGLLLSLGDVTQLQGQYERAAGYYSHAQTLAEQAPWLAGLATILSNRARIDYSMGRLRRAAERLAEALAINQRAGHRGTEPRDLNNLGLIHEELGELPQAARYLRRALVRSRELGWRGVEATALTNLGKLAHQLGRLAEARDQLSQAVALRQELANRHGEATALLYLAAVHSDAGRYSDARELAQQALQLASDLGETRAEAEARNVVGGVHLRLGRIAQASAAHARALELAAQSGDREPEIAALLGLADACLAAGHQADAEAYAARALTLARAGGYALRQGMAQTLLARICLGQGNIRGAGEYSRRALDNHRRTGHQIAQARAHVVLGHALHRAGDTATAQDHWRQAHALFTASGAPEAEDVVPLLSAWTDTADPFPPAAG